jgi:hypothetical protein
MTTCQFRMGQPRMTWNCGRYTKNGAKFCDRHADVKCQTCGKPRTGHGPKLQCPCIVWTEQGSFIQWNKCTFKSLEVVGADHR